MRTIAIAGVIALLSSTSETLFAACSTNVILYSVSGFFGRNPIAGADRLKLADEPFTVSLVACDSSVPVHSSPNSASYAPIEMLATVRSALVSTPFTIPPTPVTLTLLSQVNGQDFVQLKGVVNILGSSVSVRGSIALPSGTLTSTSVAPFPLATIFTPHSAFMYSQTDLSTTLSVIGSASASIYTPPAAGVALELHGEGARVVTTRVDGSEAERTLDEGIDLSTGSGSVMLRLYASGVPDASSIGVSVAGTAVPVIYGGPSGHFRGLSEITIQLPPGLAGAGDVPVLLTAGTETAAPLWIHIR